MNLQESSAFRGEMTNLFESMDKDGNGMLDQAQGARREALFPRSEDAKQTATCDRADPRPKRSTSLPPK